ncbi:MAG: Arm DNA-binding domain-containing protein [Paracoccaceae bacterium]|nr:Arm DNA-binding domain-containing protein [Paracoccaceae bacterium]
MENTVDCSSTSSHLARALVLRYQVEGRRRDLGLGAYPDVTIAMARDRASEARRLIIDGKDPIAQKRQTKSNTFKDTALELIESKRPGWKSTKHAPQWTATLDTYVVSKLGQMRVAKIETADVMGTLKPIWTQKPETASRVRQRISVLGVPGSGVAARLRGVLAMAFQAL